MHEGVNLIRFRELRQPGGLSPYQENKKVPEVFYTNINHELVSDG